MNKKNKRERSADAVMNSFLNGLFAVLTFPGIVVHEYAHRFFCDLAGVRVYKVCYFRLHHTAGYVIHAPIYDIRSAALVAFGPLIINSILCMLLTFPISFPLLILDAAYSSPLFAILTWAGFTIGLHAIPSDIDAAGFAGAVAEKENKFLLYLVAAPVYWLVVFTNRVLSRLWFNFFFAGLISGILPKTLLGLWVRLVL